MALEQEIVDTETIQEDPYESLYQAVSGQFNIGSFEDFTKNMDTPEERKKFFEAVSEQGFSLGEYEDYESRLKKKKHRTWLVERWKIPLHWLQKKWRQESLGILQLLKQASLP